MNNVTQAPPQPAQQPLTPQQAVEVAYQHLNLGQLQSAEGLARELLKLEPENAHGLHILGLLAQRSGQLGIALAMLEKSVRLQEGNAQFAYDLGMTARLAKLMHYAHRCQVRATELDPNNQQAWFQRGDIAMEIDQLDDAVSSIQKLKEWFPSDWGLEGSLARAYAARRQYELAEHHFQQARAWSGNADAILWDHAHNLLMMRDFANGWEAYEKRFALPSVQTDTYPYPFPVWQGESLMGKTLLLMGEQGLGDEMMFASMFGELIARAGKVIMTPQPHTAQLLQQSFPKAHVYPQLRDSDNRWLQEKPKWLYEADGQTLRVHVDYQIAFGSAARYLRSSLSDFPKHKGYLRPELPRMEHWAERLKGMRGLRVGLCWASNPSLMFPGRITRAIKRTMRLEELSPLFRLDGVSFVGLQSWGAALEVATLAPELRERMLDVHEELPDFAETAALVANLDLIITQDTAICHLAGALNKPVWIMLPWQGDWKWLAPELTPNHDSYWYPSARLYRQDALYDWASVVERMRSDLAQRKI